ncbi:MAG: small-conductance mechanosensitive channel MscS [Geothermobacteraceae bacterium]
MPEEPILSMAFVNAYVIPWSINIISALVVFIVGRFLAGVITSVVRKLLERSGMDQILVDFIGSLTRTVLVLFVIIAALDRLGVDTTSLVALLGAAGLAVGLAMKDSLGNFAAGVMLILFRPFKAGDYVEVAGTAGTVEKVGIFTTILKTPDNCEVIVPNGNIYGGNITNYAARPTRRIDLVFGIGYDDDLKQARQILQRLVDADARILKDPEPVIAVSELADSSVNFVCRPWVKKEDYWAVRWDLTEKVKLAFDEAGISIPYPQRDIHLYQEGA